MWLRKKEFNASDWDINERERWESFFAWVKKRYKVTKREERERECVEERESRRERE